MPHKRDKISQKIKKMPEDLIISFTLMSELDCIYGFF